MVDIDQDEKEKMMQKIKILSVLPPNVELNAMASNVRIYSSDKEGVSWLFSDLEGILIFALDYNLRTRYLILFDSFSFAKLFQYELYNDFHKYFEELAPDFRSFEIDSGFIGLQFQSQEDANNFDLVLTKLSGQLLANLFSTRNFSKKEDDSRQEEKATMYCKTLKENFSSDSKYDETYAEDGTEILKARNFKILDGISYNKDAKRFEIGHISEELKEMFMSFGIKKKDLEKDADFAFNLFKKIIIGLGGNSKLKNNALDNICHKFLPPEERERILREEEEAEARMNSQGRGLVKKKTKQIDTSSNKKSTQNKKKGFDKGLKPASNIIATGTTKTSTLPSKDYAKESKKNEKKEESSKASKTKTKNKPESSSCVPPPPPPPPPMPVSKVVKKPKVEPKKVSPEPENEEESAVNNTQSQAKPGGGSMEDQLKNVKLKKVTQAKQETKIMQGSEKNFLQNALSMAIKNRRANLHQHSDDEDDDDDDNNWDD